jgi:hypothetical protein
MSARPIPASPPTSRKANHETPAPAVPIAVVAEDDTADWSCQVTVAKAANDAINDTSGDALEHRVADVLAKTPKMTKS